MEIQEQKQEKKRQKLPPRPILSSSLSDAAAQTVLDALDSGFTIEDIIGEDKGPKISPRQREDQEALDQMVEMTSKGGPVPGQSLTGDPAQPKPWETPPTFANPREALTHISTLILQPKAIEGMLGSLLHGAAVTDVATAILYTSFTEGDITPDVMLMLMEPVMYLIMNIAEEANIKYNIDKDDMDEMDEEDPEEIDEKINEFKSAFEDIKNSKPVKSVNKQKLKTDPNILPQSILTKVKEKGPEIQSILSRE
mgnify:CR=1 FL=1|tara:strand:+ start:313 stop:1071 length:759 start_codon:yes stop_codon:yes gene_type:complete